MANVTLTHNANPQMPLLENILQINIESYKDSLYHALNNMSKSEILETYKKTNFMTEVASDCFQLKRKRNNREINQIFRQGVNPHHVNTWFYTCLMQKQYIAKYLHERDLLLLIIDNLPIWLDQEKSIHTWVQKYIIL